jgi:UDP-glucose 4-epimerase
MILITGGLGFIGLNTARAFLEAGEAVVLTRYQTHREPEFLTPYLGKRAFVEQVDVLKASDLVEVGRRHPITGIVHLAGAHIAGLAPADGLRATALGTLNVLEAASAMGVKRVSLASSTTVYIGVVAECWREDLPLPIASPYPVVAYKKLLEIMGDHYAAQTHLDVVSLRIPLVYGPYYRSMNNLASRMVQAAVTGVPGPLPAPGRTPTPTFEDDENWNLCFAADCGEAIARVQLAPRLAHTIYNIGGAANVTNRELADAVREVVPGAQLSLQPGRSQAPQVSPLDLTRIQADTGWTPRFSLEAGIAEYVSWLNNISSGMG